MTDDSRKRFGWGSIIAAAILGGLVPAVASPFIVDWIREGVDEQGLEGFWTPVLSALALVVLAGLVFLLALTVIRRSWRENLWVRFGRWIKGNWPVTTRRLERETAAADAAGYDRRSAEVEKQRQDARKPRWTVEPTTFGTDWFLLRNWGHPVIEVRIDPVDTDFFVPLDKAYWAREVFDSNNGKQFKGRLTGRGRDEGVSFKVQWIDSNGDPDERVIVFDKRPLAEQPRWEIGRPKKGAQRDWALVNYTESVATDVRVECDSSYLTVTESARWDELNGPKSGLFSGVLREGGQAFGVDFEIYWTDGYGVEMVSPFHMTAPTMWG